MPGISQLIVESFKYGWDTRRSQLTSVPGTLYRVTNGHITQGGAIQKRKAFIRLTRASGTGSLPANTFGLQQTATGLLVFASDDLSTAVFPTSPVTVSYQRLRHPAVLAGESYDAAKHAMTGVRFSEIFGGYAFVIATFADGGVYCYYNGTLVYDLVDGLVLADMTTTAEVAQAIVDAVNRTASYTASRVGSVVTITGPDGLDYQPTITEDSSSGTISTGTVTQTARQYRVGVSAVASFRIMGGRPVSATPTSATGSVVSTATNPSDGDYVIIGNKRYTFKTTISTEGHVLIGANAAASLTNLKKAINRESTYGTEHMCFQAHPYVSAGTITGSPGTLPLTAHEGSSGNSVTLTASFAAAAWTVSGTDMTGGAGSCVASVKVIAPSQSTTELISTAVPFTTNAAATATLVAAEINANTSAGLTHGYTAEADDTLVTVLSATTASPQPSKYVLQVAVGGNVCIGDCLFYFTQPNTAAGFTITYIRAGGVEVMGSQAYPVSGSIDTFAELYSAIETSINSNSGTHEIVSVAAPDYIQVARLVTRSDDPDLPVYVLVAGSPPAAGVVFGSKPVAPQDMDVELADTHVAVSVSPPASTHKTTEPLSVQVVGGVGPFTYSWQESFTNSGKGTLNNGTAVFNYEIKPLITNGPTTAFALYIFTNNFFLNQDGVYTGRFTCKVTDSAGTQVMSNEVVVSIIVEGTPS